MFSGSGFQKEEHPGPALEKTINSVLDPDPDLDPDLAQSEKKVIRSEKMQNVKFADPDPTNPDLGKMRNIQKK